MKRIFPLLLLSIISLSSKSQNFYFGLSGAYALPILGSNVGLIYEADSVNRHYENIAGSYGSGYNAGLLLGYSLSPHFSFDLSFNYLKGKTYSDSRKYNYLNPVQTSEFSRYARTYSLTPSVKYTIQKNWFEFFFRSGLNIGLSTTYYEKYSAWTAGQFTEERINEVYDKWSWGMQVGAGLGIKLSESLKTTFSCNFTGANYNPESGRLISWQKNGIDQMPNLTVADKEYVFKEWPDVNLYYTNPDQPREVYSFALPMSSIAFQIGLEYSFLKKAK